METSEQINELAAALSKAQGKITGALKDSSNPFFKSKYADLAACWDACREQLASNGLAVIQTTADPAEGAVGVTVITRLVHSSGQWVQGRITLAPKDSGPQATGSTLTYARRYALAAIVGLAQIDDDAEAAQGRHNGLPRIDPRGEDHKRENMDEAQEYASRFRAALDSGIEGRILELHNECNQRQDFYIAVSACLNPPERARIKAIIRGARQ